MTAWLNLALLVASTGLSVFLYIRSVRPASLEKRIGPSAYKRCARDRFVATALMLVGMANYVVYYFHPLPIPLPRTFPWRRWVSVLVAALLAVPSGYLMVRGLIDAGEEAAIPKKEHGLYGGIYERVRHPQAWEAGFWFVAAFLLHSPFLVLYSLLWLPLEYAMVMAEEPDLVLRFGEAYEEYRGRTPAFWPRGGLRALLRRG